MSPRGLPARVVFVSHDAQIAGAQLSLVDQVAALTRVGVEAHVIVPAREGWPQLLLPILRDAGAVVHHGPVARWVQTNGESASWFRLRLRAALPRAARFVAHVVRDVGAEIVVTNTALPLSGVVGAQQAGVPHAWFIRERLGRDDIIGAFGRSYMTDFIARHSHVFVASAFVHDEFSSWCPPERLHRIRGHVRVPPPLTEAELRAQAAAPPTTLLFPGGLHSVKRPGDVVGAMALLQHEWPELKLRMTGHGGGSTRTELEARVAAAGLSHRVEIDGFIDEPWGNVLPGTVVVSAGVDETFGRIPVEAMARGVPVVAADGAAIPEVVRHESTGLLFEGRSPASLAAAILRLRDDAALRERVIRGGHEAAHHEWTSETHLTDLARAFAAMTAARS